MRFANRNEAGQQLAKALMHYQGLPKGLVLGLPRGGVPVAFEVASALHLPLDVTCPHKIGAPNNPEFAVAAITEYGECLQNKEAVAAAHVSRHYLEQEAERETKRARNRLAQYRDDATPRVVADKIVLLVDDGLATGFTMKAAIQSMRAERASKIVVAVPVSPPETLQEIKQLVDEVVCLYAPSMFMAVGQFYDDFRATTDDDVIHYLRGIS